MRKRDMTLKKRIMVPLLVLVLFQLLVFLLIFFKGGVSRRLRELPVDMLVQSTDIERDYLNRTVFQRQMRSVEQYDTVTELVNQVLEEEGAGASAIHTDFSLNQKITERISPELIDLLHRSGTNGIYVILDGPAAEKSGADVKAGVYIRDFDSSGYAADNSDLFLERGISRISKNWSIPLSSYWEQGFSMSELSSQDYFYEPYLKAKEDGAKTGDRSQYRYISDQSRVGGDIQSVVTYSVPLILDSGEVIGVIGMDITTVQFQSLMNVQSIGSRDYGVSMYGRWDAKNHIFYPTVPRGAMYDRYFNGLDGIVCKDSGFASVYLTEAKNGDLCYAALGNIDIYDRNTPFEQEQWAVMNVLSEQDLFGSYYQIRNLMVLSIVLAGIFAVATLLLISSMILKPISRLSEELRENGHGTHVKIGRLHIREIDYLIDSIEMLSASVAGTASKNSRILGIAGISVGVFEFNPGTPMIFCNRMMCRMMRWEIPEDDFCYVEVEEFEKRMQVVQEQRGTYPGLDEESSRKNSIYHFIMDKNIWMKLKVVKMQNGSIVGVLTDVTQDVAQRVKMEYDMSYDSLTGLYNRRAFKARVEEMIRKRKYPVMAMVLWDLDNLKYINDTYGHDEGDRYLVAFVAQLLKIKEDSCLLCRYSGDEFYAFFYGETKHEIRQHLKTFMEDLSRSEFVMPGNRNMPLRASGGVAWCPEDSEDYVVLIKYADFAMYTVKHSVKGILREYNEEEYREKSYMLAGKEELNQLVESERVPFAMQPIVDRRGELYGYELLMRPRLKVLRDITEVLNLAKEQAKLSQMEDLTWRAAFAWIREHDRRGELPEGIKYFINSIASVRLSDMGIRKLEEEYQPYLQNLVVELTESEPISQESMKRKLELVARWNAQIAVDDFGSGYNSETLLADMNADIVKLDMRLIRNIHKDNRRQMLVSNVIQYARELNIRVLAEGVEEEDEVKCLMNMGVDYFQGYYVARPETEIKPVDEKIREKIRGFDENRG